MSDRVIAVVVLALEQTRRHDFEEVGVEGFGEICVGAGIVGFHLMLFGDVGRKDEDRKMLGELMTADKLEIGRAHV